MRRGKWRSWGLNNAHAGAFPWEQVGVNCGSQVSKQGSLIHGQQADGALRSRAGCELNPGSSLCFLVQWPWALSYLVCQLHNFFKHFFLWTVFKVFIEFATILLLFLMLFFFFLPWGKWDLSSLTRIKNAPPALEGEILTIGIRGMSLHKLLIKQCINVPPLVPSV